MTQVPTYQYGGGGDLPPQARKSNGLSIAALICGIAAFVIAWIPVLNCIAPLIALVALVLGIVGAVMASKDPVQKPTLAIIGIILSVLAFGAFFISWMIVGAWADRAGGGLVALGAGPEADAIVQEARSRGVPEDEISAARAEFDESMEDIPSGMEDAQSHANTALQRLRDRLDVAEGEVVEPEMDEPPSDEPPDESGGGA